MLLQNLKNKMIKQKLMRNRYTFFINFKTILFHPCQLATLALIIRVFACLERNERSHKKNFFGPNTKRTSLVDWKKISLKNVFFITLQAICEFYYLLLML